VPGVVGSGLAAILSTWLAIATAGTNAQALLLIFFGSTLVGLVGEPYVRQLRTVRSTRNSEPG